MPGGIAALTYTVASSCKLDIYSGNVYTPFEVGTCHKNSGSNRSRSYGSIC
jgi:hypothetical protein